MNIVHVCRQYYPGVGGLEAVVEALAKRQASAGHIVKVLTLNRIFGAPQISLNKTETLDGVEIIRMPFFGSERYPVALSVLHHIKPADLVHVHAIDFFFDFLALTRLLHGKPLVATTHGGFFHTSFASRLKKIWFATVTRTASHAYASIAACSGHDKALFDAISPRRVCLIENGVDTEKFRGLAASDAHSMIYFGRLAPNKGFERLLRWFAEVRRRAPEWTLTIAGKPDGVTATSLRALSAELGIGHSVSIIESPGDERLKRLIARSSVYVCASTYEGFGLAAVEAASAGLLPVLSKVPAFEATMARLGSGLLIDFDAARAEAERFLEVWQKRSDAGLEAMAERAASAFSWQQSAAGYGRLYDEVLHGRRQIGGVRIDVLPRSAAIRRIRSHFFVGHRPLMVAFCNAHSVNTARTNPAFAQSIQSALVLNDGIGIDIASRVLFGRAFPDNLNGTDFVPALLDEEKRTLRIFLLGSAPGVVERAARAMRRRFPKHLIVGVHHGHYAATDEDSVLAEVAEAEPDLVLVGMGHPRQEIWAANFGGRLPAVVMCVGAYIDFIAGVVSRAPLWMRRARVEWVYRLIQEPRRLAGRYIVGNLSFLYFVARQRLLGADGLPGPLPQPQATEVRPQMRMRA